MNLYGEVEGGAFLDGITIGVSLQHLLAGKQDGYSKIVSQRISML